MPEHDLWIRRAMILLDMALKIVHATQAHTHSTGLLYDRCVWGQCAATNRLISNAQDMGYHDPKVPERI